MDYQVIWSPEAVDDIDDIAAHIAKDPPIYAQAVVEQLIEASRTLPLFPLCGRAVPELQDDHYRETFIQSYRLIYPAMETEVRIAAVIHGTRLLERVERFANTDRQ